MARPATPTPLLPTRPPARHASRRPTPAIKVETVALAATAANPLQNRGAATPAPLLANAPLRWPGLLALMLAMFAVAVGYGVALPALPFWLEGMITPADPSALSRHAGFVTGTYVFASFIFGPLWGRVADRRGRRGVLIVGALGFALTSALSALVDNLPMLYVSRFVAGLFASAIAPAAFALMSDWAPTRAHRAHRFALLNLANGAGLLIGPMIGGFALLAPARFFGASGDARLAPPLIVTAGLAFLAAGLVFLLTKEGRARVEHSTAINPEVNRTLIAPLLLISFATALAIGVFEVGLSLQAKLVLDLNAYQIGTMFAECSLVMILVQALVFSPFVKPKTTRYLIAPSLAALTLGLVALPSANSFVQMSLAIALIAASAGILLPIATFWISLAAGAAQGFQLGRQTSAANLGQAIGAAASGFFLGVAVATANAAFWLTAAVVAGGLWISIGLTRRLRAVGAEEARDSSSAGGD